MTARYRRTPEVERKYVRLELADGWVRVASRVVILLLAVSSAGVSLICAIHGGPWLVVGLASSASAAAGRLLVQKETGAYGQLGRSPQKDAA